MNIGEARPLPKVIADWVTTDYLDEKGYKAVAVALASNGGYASGMGVRYPDVESAIKGAIKNCNDVKRKYVVLAPCKVRYLGNKDVSGLSDTDFKTATVDYSENPSQYADTE